ncbi:schlafen family member 13-like [Paramuricea clavata]|uniref:Schlafen family member 13-like n=1 Tax=Paramuricea clavata TaxID=317549 RepID=A0A6S7KD36_PARCT|nr:schlafen family member 13-like [Paramuricea clavata]
MTGKGNKFSCYVSAFPNYNGGHIYYGIRDAGIVEGELISNEEDIGEITKKVEKAINKMIWPEQVGQPKRGVHWEIFFQPVVDENSKPIPSTFVVVIYIAPCLGGVFTEEPECYEMVEGKVKKMSFATWKRRVLHTGWLRSGEEIPSSVQRITWSSREARKTFTVKGEKLRKLINKGDWDAFSRECQILQRKCQACEMKLLVLSKQVTACYRRGSFNEARILLEEYKTILSQAQDHLIFEVIRLYLQAALKRASGDFQELARLLTEALSKAELIEPGLVTATVYVFAATVTDLINSKDPSNKLDSPDVLSIRALEHLQRVPDSSDVIEDMKQKVHVILATFHLGSNISGQHIKGSIDNLCLDKAKTSIAAVYKSVIDGNSLSAYRDVQVNLVQSVCNYRHSQVSSPDQRTRLLRSAFDCAKKAKCLAKQYNFTEMLQWCKTNQALCTEELVRVTLEHLVRKPSLQE